MTWSGGGGALPVVPLAALLGPAGAGETTGTPPRSADGPLAILRSGREIGAIGFDRIVWRENARLTPLPPRLYPVEEVLGGILAADNRVTLVLHPAAVLRRMKLRRAEGVTATAPRAHEDGA
jgi:chemotaxis protein histidine kinase CheA